MSPQTIQEIVKKALDDCPAGAYCFFVRLNSLKGVKCYPCKQKRDTAKNRQRLCYDAGEAPEPFEELEFAVDYYDFSEDEQIDYLYCYVTEPIDPCVPYGDDEKCDIFEADYDKDISLAQIRISDLTGWYPNDPHGYNWGWNDGKLQLLDFI